MGRGKGRVPGALELFSKVFGSLSRLEVWDLEIEVMSNGKMRKGGRFVFQRTRDEMRVGMQ